MMNRTKVLTFIPTLYNGGAESLVKEYALLIDRDKIDFKIVILRDLPDSVNSRILREKGIRYSVIYSKNNFFSKVLKKCFGKWYIPYKLKKIVRSEKPNCIHIHLHLMDHIRKISNDLQGIKLFFTCHSEASKHFQSEQEISNIRYLIQNNHLRLITLNESMKRDLDCMFDVSNTVVLYNGIDFRRFQNISESKENIRNSLNIPQNAFVVGHIGRFLGIKNHKFIIEIFEKIYERNQNAFLLLVGNGELKEDIKNQILISKFRDRSLILSNRTDVPRILKSMDVFVFPSYYEGLSMALIEAQVSGLRCVVSDSIDDSNFMTDTTIPLSIQDSADRWADALLDSNITVKTSRRIEEYDMQLIVKKLENLYAENI